jgi:hypothetical protein
MSSRYVAWHPHPAQLLPLGKHLVANRAPTDGLRVLPQIVARLFQSLVRAGRDRTELHA